MIYIYTENLFFLPRVKNRIKKILGVYKRGPQVVLSSLLTGLTELKESFVLNKDISEPIQSACVLSGIKTLEWAIKQKKLGKIKKLIAGPNIAVAPTDVGGILLDPDIDRIIVPSQWVKEYYVSVVPKIEKKIAVWPAGVNIPENPQDEKTFDFLIYNKIGQNQLYFDIVGILKEKGYTYKVFDYGKFYQSEYFNKLQQSRFEIYLSESESQGIAMFEAWARGVPTYVWEKGFFEKKGIKIFGKISSPYLNSSSGLVFSSAESFKADLNIFINGTYAPKEHVKKNFADKICAQAFIKLLL